MVCVIVDFPMEYHRFYLGAELFTKYKDRCLDLLKYIWTQCLLCVNFAVISFVVGLKLGSRPGLCDFLLEFYFLQVNWSVLSVLACQFSRHVPRYISRYGDKGVALTNRSVSNWCTRHLQFSFKVFGFQMLSGRIKLKKYVCQKSLLASRSEFHAMLPKCLWSFKYSSSHYESSYYGM